MQNDEIDFDNGEKDKIPYKISMFSDDDANLKILGEILSNESSRKIMSLLIRKEMTVNEIITNTGYALSLVLHHLNKMKETGIVEISKIGKNSKNHDMKYYVAKPAIIIFAKEMSEKAKQSKSFQNSLRRLLKYTSIGIAAIISWFGTQAVQNQEIVKQLLPPGSESSNISADLFWPIMVTLSVIISGLITERILNRYLKNR
ncbi:MAG: ArsR/SmtB family transcription factor [Rhabdochlamydiaceae bacterium]